MSGHGAVPFQASWSGFLAACFVWWMLGWAVVSDAGAQSAPGERVSVSLVDSTGSADLVDSIAVQLPVDAWNPDLSAFLSHAPGTFEYTFGAAGWPDAISRYGAEPERMDLRFGGLPFTDLLTGRPLYEMTPEIMIGGITKGTHGTRLEPRAFRDPFPLTLMRYQAAGNAWQDVQVVHAQNRVRGESGRGDAGAGGASGSASDRSAPPDCSGLYRLHTLFGYTGGGAGGGIGRRPPLPARARSLAALPSKTIGNSSN